VHFYISVEKQAKMQWLQDQNQSNVDNMSSVRREAIFRKKKIESLKTNIKYATRRVQANQ
jgi:Fe-S cluster assembly scaffold protein SufB